MYSNVNSLTLDQNFLIVQYWQFLLLVVINRNMIKMLSR